MTSSVKGEIYVKTLETCTENCSQIESWFLFFSLSISPLYRTWVVTNNIDDDDNNNNNNINNNNDDDEDDDDDDDRIERHNSRFSQSAHCAANCLQHARSSGQGAIVCKPREHKERFSRATCHVPCGTKGQLSH